MKIVPAVSSMVGEPQSPPPVHPPGTILKVFRMDPLGGSRRKNLDWFNGQSPKEEVPMKTSRWPLIEVTVGELATPPRGGTPEESVVCPMKVDQTRAPVLALDACT